MSPRAILRAACLCGLGSVLLACGGASSAPAPAAAPTAETVAAAAATPSPRPKPPAATPTKRNVGPTPTPRCPDPYVDGAPYERTPDAPIRLRPTGFPQPIARFTPGRLVKDAALDQVVRRSLRGVEDHVAVLVKNLADDHGVVLDGDRKFYAASLYKTWSLIEAFNQGEAGLLDFDERYVVTDYYEAEFGLNPGELETCQEIAFHDALGRMMRVSDNVAANLVLDRVGVGNVNASLRGLGLDDSGFVADGSMPTTADDMALLLEALYRGRVVSRQASDGMLLHLVSELINDRLPALLPKGTTIAHKTGNWENATHDAGIVFSPDADYVIVVLTDYGFVADGAEVIARLSKVVYDYYNGG